MYRASATIGASSVRGRRARTNRHIEQAALETLEQRRMLSASDLDSSFGSGGIVTTDFDSGFDFAQGAAVQSDGMIVAVGFSDSGGVMARYTSSGVLDGSFGTGGRVSLAAYGFDDAIGVAMSGNKIVVVGTNFNSFNGDFVVARFNSNGTIDNTTFGIGDPDGIDGVAIVNSGFDSLAGNIDTAAGVVVGSGGFIFVGGTTDHVNSTDFAILKLDPNGSPEINFGAGGWAFANFGGSPTNTDVAHAIALDSSNHVLIGGEVENQGNAGTDFGVARFSQATGALDNTFSGDGLVTSDFGDSVEFIHSLAIGAGDSIFVTGFYNAIGGFFAGAIARYDSSGTLDTTFGGTSDGLVIVPDTADATGIAIDSTGNLLVAAYNESFEVVLARFDSTGNADPGFGTTGQVTTAVGSVAQPGGVVIQPTDDKPIVFGYSDDDFMLVRYGETASADPVADAGNDQSVNEGDLVFFNASNSTGDNLSFEWDLDDDGFFDDATGPAASFTFGDNGDNIVRVRVTDDQVRQAVDSLTVHVANVNPTPGAIVAPTSGVRLHAISFSGSFTDPGFLDTHMVRWDFGDGNVIALHSSNDAGALTPTHAYATTGTFLVTFGVRDDDNSTVFTQSLSVTISAAGIVGGNLLVGGTGAADKVTIQDKVNGIFKVKIGNVVVGEFNEAGITKIILQGGDGDDDLNIEADITKDSEMYGGNGDDVLKGGGGRDIMFGGAGNDKIKARNADDIGIGGSGDDTLAGGDGRDILIGGLGADKIAGQDDADILIAGNTSHDENLAALTAIRAEWSLGGSIATRVNNVRNGLGLTMGHKFLANVTVFDDNAKDTLAGGSGSDWFIANTSGSGVLDKITGLNSADFVDDLDFILGP